MIGGSSLLTVSFTPDAPVPFAARAELIAVADKDQLRLYTRDELETEPVESVDGSRQSARVRVPAGGGLLLAEGRAELAIAHRRGVLATAALLVGLSGRMLELTVAHVRERHQFGVPVGSFQAVKHALADVELAVRFARPHGPRGGLGPGRPGSRGRRTDVDGEGARVGGRQEGGPYGDPVPRRHRIHH